MKTALVILPREMLQEHVGVKRVVKFVCEEIENLSIDISLAFYEEGKFFLFPIKLKASEEIQKGPSVSFFETLIGGQESVYKKADPFSYDYQIISCPWIVDDNFPILNNCIGMGYDLVPNLLAANIIHFPGTYIECSLFAKEHKIGYEYYMRHCKRVLTISKSTATDLANLFGDEKASTKIVPFIPYRRRNSSTNVVRKSNQILMVNCFDFRKNFVNACEILKSVSSTVGIKVVAVGKARMDERVMDQVLTGVRNSNIDFDWRSSCGDHELFNLYSESSVLFFPSIYEGLGLPILEAQDFHCPAISSDSSSCGEVNFVKELTGPWDNKTNFQHKILDVLEGKIPLPKSFEEEWINFFKSYATVPETFSLF